MQIVSRRNICFISLLISISLSAMCKSNGLPERRICITFDDKYPRANNRFDSETGNNMVLASLKKHHVRAAYFVQAGILNDELGRRIVKQWNDNRHIIANHTYSHYDYHNADITFEKYKHDFLRADSLLRQFSQFKPIFRYPKLNKGNTIAKRDSFRNVLKKKHYQIGYVTVDNSEWYINYRIRKKMIKHEYVDVDQYRRVYLDHLTACLNAYDRLAKDVTGRTIPHILLLHNNTTSALFLDDLLSLLKQNGWTIADPIDVLNDRLFQIMPDIKYSDYGEGFIEALAKQNGTPMPMNSYFSEIKESVLENRMNELGL
ncbi:polysaccharide deacetylase family protein [candidate division KSB1 bacterium]|nr:polysaccharide deacetylase family protein [candidate division KSB1 bacterium]